MGCGCCKSKPDVANTREIPEEDIPGSPAYIAKHNRAELAIQETDQRGGIKRQAQSGREGEIAESAGRTGIRTEETSTRQHANALYKLVVEESRARKADGRSNMMRLVSKDETIEAEEMRVRFVMRTTFATGLSVLKRRNELREAICKLPDVEDSKRKGIEALRRFEHECAVSQYEFGVAETVIRAFLEYDWRDARALLAIERGDSVLRVVIRLRESARRMECLRFARRSAHEIAERARIREEEGDARFSTVRLAALSTSEPLGRQRIESTEARSWVRAVNDLDCARARDECTGEEMGAFAELVKQGGLEEVECLECRDRRIIVSEEEAGRSEAGRWGKWSLGRMREREGLFAEEGSQRGALLRAAREETGALGAFLSQVEAMVQGVVQVRMEERKARAAILALRTRGEAEECEKCGIDPALVWEHWAQRRQFQRSSENGDLKAEERRTALLQQTLKVMRTEEYGARKIILVEEARMRARVNVQYQEWERPSALLRRRKDREEAETFWGTPFRKLTPLRVPNKTRPKSAAWSWETACRPPYEGHKLSAKPNPSQVAKLPPVPAPADTQHRAVAAPVASPPPAHVARGGLGVRHVPSSPGLSSVHSVHSPSPERSRAES
eukprot:Hpha_TRINITY_DN15888_c1_g3::TRINITY_DN15888_c1_g3_i1::g.188867::m.188867